MKNTALMLLPGMIWIGLGLTAIAGQAENAPLTGMVWEIHGRWHLDRSPSVVRLGQEIPGKSLLTADRPADKNSALVLMPDGQRLLFECFDEASCAQGFRVPQVTGQPEGAAWSMFAAVRDRLQQRPLEDSVAYATPAGRQAQGAKYEFVTAMDKNGEVSVESMFRRIPAGRYTLELTTDGQALPPSIRPLDWKGKGGSANIAVGINGLYRVKVLDQAHVARLDIFMMVVPRESLDGLKGEMGEAEDALSEWNENYAGWPIHDFKRVYLEALEHASK